MAQPGSAPAWHAGGQGFESPWIHRNSWSDGHSETSIRGFGMAVRHLFDTSPHSAARSRGILGASRGFAGPPAHLSRMSNETVDHTDFESTRGCGGSTRAMRDIRAEADGERRAPAYHDRRLRRHRHPAERSRLHRHGAVPRRRRTAPTGDGIGGFQVRCAGAARGTHAQPGRMRKSGRARSDQLLDGPGRSAPDASKESHALYSGR
jgi:hypothetical protein